MPLEFDTKTLAFHSSLVIGDPSLVTFLITTLSLSQVVKLSSLLTGVYIVHFILL
jgi:hypothetical protein